MKQFTIALLVLAFLSFPSLAKSAAAVGPNQDVPPGDDLGVQLVDMFATIADVLSAHQSQIANESHLGSQASSRRLGSAILHAPDMSVWGARPFVEGWGVGED